MEINSAPRCCRDHRRGNTCPQLLQPNLERPWSSRYLRSLARGQLGLGRMASNLPRNIQHHDTHLSRGAVLSEEHGPAMAAQESGILFHALLVASIVIGFYAFPYAAPVLGLIGCIVAVFGLGWLAKKIPNTRPVSRSLKLLASLSPSGLFGPGCVVLPLQQRDHSLCDRNHGYRSVTGLGIREAAKPLVAERMD